MPPASTFGKVSRSHLRNIHLRNATLFIDGAATGGGARACERKSRMSDWRLHRRGNFTRRRGRGILEGCAHPAFEFYDSHLPVCRSVWRARLSRDRTASATRLMAGAFLIKRLLN